MKQYTEVIQRKFPDDNRLGFYIRPNLPATKIGMALMGYTKIASPSDVVAVLEYGSFLSKKYLILTHTECYYGKGSFKLEDLKSVILNQKDTLQIAVNQGGSIVNHILDLDNEQVAALLINVFDEISNTPKEVSVEVKADYSQYSREAVQWLEIRDEVMKTIDLLNQKFQDGKLSLLEFEEKKSDLLSRL